MRHWTLVTGITALVSCFTFGCSSDQSTSDETHAATDSVAVTSGESASSASSGKPSDAVDAATNSKAATKNQPAFMKDMPGLEDPGKIKWDRESAASATIPDALPVYANSNPLGGSSDRRFFVFEWESSDTKEDIHQFYRQQLNESGWEVEPRRVVGLVKASKGKQEIDVWIGGEPNKPVSILVRFKK